MGNTNGSLSIIRNFAVVSADEATNSGGASPSALLALSGGTLYGTTTAGGSAANGTIFSLTTNGATFSVLHNFSVLDSQAGTNLDGALSCGGLILSGDKLYGTASAGGAGGCGVVFSINTNGGNFIMLHSFTPMDTLTATNTDGAMPLGGLVLSSNALYGTTYAGGSSGHGTIFSIQTNGNGFTVLHHFTSTDPVTTTNTDGASPSAALLFSSNMLYGTAAGAGAAGTVFSVPIPAPPAVITNIVQNVDGSVTLSFLGAPNSTNIIQATASLTPPVMWQNVSANVADANGAWQFTNNNNSTTTRFYRSYAP